MNKFFTCLAALFTAVLALHTAGADLTQPTGNAQEENPLGMLVSHTLPGSYQAGQPIEVMITIRFVSAGEGITALGFTEEIPPGWMFQSMGNLVAGLMPTITPQPGAQEQLGFAWITIPPEFPYQFTYFLMPAEDAAGQQTISGQGEYRLSAGRQLSDIDIVVLNGKDGTPPRITLLGENPMTIEEGSPYVEPGFTATDNVDGNVTNRVQVSGQVNTQVAGTYTLTYSVSDRAGNAATPVIRSVIVVEPADDGNNGGVPPDGSGGSGGTPRPRTRRGGYGGYGYYPGQDYVDPATQQPVNPNAAQQEQAQPLAVKPNQPQPGAPPAQMYARGNAASSNTASSGEGGLILPGDMKINWPAPGEENADASKAEPGPNVAKPNAPPESVTATAAPATAAAPETATATTLAAAPAAKAENTGVVAAAPAAAANTGAVAATMPPVPSPPKPGLFESMSAAVSKMQTADWLRLGIVMAVLAIIGVLAGIAWRGAYSPPPRRKTSNGARS